MLLDEGKSAYKGVHLSNGELGKFLAEADRGNYRGYAFLVEEQDRLSRQGIMATFAVVGRLLEAGIEIHVTEKNLAIRSFEDLDNLAISVPTLVNGSTANEYSKKLSARVSSARSSEREKARETGLAVTAKVPSWLRAEIGKKPVLIPERAATVRRIFELAGLGLGAKRIVRTLEKEGRKPFAVGKYGQEWTPEFVGKTLGNRAVLGEYQPHRLVNGKRVPLGEPILDFTRRWLLRPSSKPPAGRWIRKTATGARPEAIAAAVGKVPTPYFPPSFTTTTIRLRWSTTPVRRESPIS